MSGAFVFDSSPLNYFTRAGLIDQLHALVQGSACFITRAVEDELLRGASSDPQLYQAVTANWLTIVEDASLGYLQTFSAYHRVLGDAAKNVGEATTLAYAELRGFTAVIDERAGTRVGQDRGVHVVSSLRLVADGLRQGTMSESEAAAIVDLLGDHEAYLPCSGGEFVEWARANGMLD